MNCLDVDLRNRLELRSVSALNSMTIQYVLP